MLDEQEQFLLHQIRILLKQLDERQTKQKDEEIPYTVTAVLQKYMGV